MFKLETQKFDYRTQYADFQIISKIFQNQYTDIFFHGNV